MKTHLARLPGPFEGPNIGPVETYVRALLPIANSSHLAPLSSESPGYFALSRIMAAVLDISRAA